MFLYIMSPVYGTDVSIHGGNQTLAGTLCNVQSPNACRHMFSLQINRTRSDHAMSGQARPGQTRPNRTRPTQTNPYQTKPGQTRPNLARPDLARPGRTRPNPASYNCPMLTGEQSEQTNTRVERQHSSSSKNSIHPTLGAQPRGQVVRMGEQ